MVYVDHDPVVLAHSRALLVTDDGVIAVKSDFRDPAEVLGDPALTGLIDFAEPVAVLFLSVLHFIGDEENPGQIVAGFRDRLPAGGYLVISAITSENMDHEVASGVSDLYRSARTPGVARSREQIMEFFAGCQAGRAGAGERGAVAARRGHRHPDDPGAHAGRGGAEGLRAGLGRAPGRRRAAPAYLGTGAGDEAGAQWEAEPGGARDISTPRTGLR